MKMTCKRIKSRHNTNSKPPLSHNCPKDALSSRAESLEISGTESIAAFGIADSP